MPTRGYSDMDIVHYIEAPHMDIHWQNRMLSCVFNLKDLSTRITCLYCNNKAELDFNSTKTYRYYDHSNKNSWKFKGKQILHSFMWLCYLFCLIFNLIICKFVSKTKHHCWSKYGTCFFILNFLKLCGLQELLWLPLYGVSLWSPFCTWYLPKGSSEHEKSGKTIFRCMESRSRL